MSAYAYIGLQGSGKTLKAVNTLYDNFINPKTKDKSDYDYALTNINEFDFSKSDKINKLDFEILYSQLVQLYELSVNQQCTDTQLNEKAKEFNLFNCLIVVDEAPHYLTKEKDTVLLWWIEYHRHMYQDIILITPNKARFRTEYRNSIHYFVKSVSAKYRIRKDVYKYAVFSNYSMNKDDFEHFENFKVRKELFSLYQSGKSINGTPIFYKILPILVLLLIFLIVYFYSFLTQFSSDNEVEEIKTVELVNEKKTNQISNNQNVKKISNNEEQKESINSIISFKNESLFKLKCKNDMCYINIEDTLYELPFIYVDNLISSLDPKKLFIKQSKIFTTFYITTNSDYFDFIIKKSKGVKNDKENNSLLNFGK